MAVPDYQSLMLPLLQLAGDAQEHSISESIEELATNLGLTEEDRYELLPSGRQFRLDNRVRWARHYLIAAGLLSASGRGKFQITERGALVLRDNPPYINNKLLKQFPEFQEFMNPRSGRDEEITSELEEQPTQTPEEILESSYQNLRNSLAQELIERVKSCSPRFFERLVVDLLVRMGYGGSRKDAGRAIGQSGDGGIDGIINEDRLGLDVVYVQAKRWDGTVGRPVVQGFAGSLEGFRARKGVLITTSNFTKDALQYVERIEKKIILINGEQLAQYMIDYGVGVTEVATYTVKRADLDYFGEEV
ncbi:MAG: restriction endonuclease [Anaerolineae bacterium]|nr:restriction endonuclease [Anaerolineae bacterium]